MMNTAVASNHPSIRAAISHELRIPLTGIMATANFLNKTSLNQQQQEYIQTIQVYAKQLLGLENQIYAAVKTHKKISFSAKGIVKTAHSLESTQLDAEQKEYIDIMLVSAYRLRGLKQKIFAFVKSYNTLPA